MLKQCLAASVALLVVGSATFAPAATWTYKGQFPSPNWGLGETNGVQRLCADSAGNLYLSVNAGSPAEYIFKCVAPTDVMTTPSYTQVLQDSAMLNGFQGMVTDASNNLYVMGESGTTGTGTLRKFDSSGNLVAGFGTAGVVTTTDRLTGMALLSNNTLVATTVWGSQLYSFNTTTGAQLGAVQSPLSTFTRDLAVRPDPAAGNDVIFAVQSGLLKKLSGGSATNLAGYTTIVDWCTGGTPAPVNVGNSVRPGACYSASDNTVIFGNFTTTISPTNCVYVVDASTGNCLQTIGDGTYGSGPTQLAGPSDVAVIVQGAKKFLYISTQAGYVVVYTQDSTAVVNEWSLFN